MHFDPCILCRICSICTAMLNKSQVDVSVLTWALLQVCRQLYLSGGIITRVIRDEFWQTFLSNRCFLSQLQKLRKQWIAERNWFKKQPGRHICWNLLERFDRVMFHLKKFGLAWLRVNLMLEVWHRNSSCAPENHGIYCMYLNLHIYIIYIYVCV